MRDGPVKLQWLAVEGRSACRLRLACQGARSVCSALEGAECAEAVVSLIRECITVELAEIGQRLAQDFVELGGCKVGVLMGAAGRFGDDRIDDAQAKKVWRGDLELRGGFRREGAILP